MPKAQVQVQRAILAINKAMLMLLFCFIIGQQYGGVPHNASRVLRRGVGRGLRWGASRGLRWGVGRALNTASSMGKNMGQL